MEPGGRLHETPSEVSHEATALDRRVDDQSAGGCRRVQLEREWHGWRDYALGPHLGPLLGAIPNGQCAPSGAWPVHVRRGAQREFADGDAALRFPRAARRGSLVFEWRAVC